MPGSFLDTNVLVYFASGDATRAERARSLLAGGPTISMQVLNELAAVARRKMHLSWDEVRDVTGRVRMAASRIVPLTLEVHELGLNLAERYHLSIYDAMLLSAAILSDCDHFWSEDMHNGLVVEGVLTIKNPF